MRTVIVDNKNPNAGVMGFPGMSKLIWTTGAMEVWTESEREAVLAHEMTHLRECHVLIKMAIMGGFGGLAVRSMLNDITASASVQDMEAAQKRMKYYFIAEITTLLLVSYICERRADAGAFKRGHGTNLASALSKLSKPSKRSMFTAALRGSVHPTTKSRIRRLTK